MRAVQYRRFCRIISLERDDGCLIEAEKLNSSSLLLDCKQSIFRTSKVSAGIKFAGFFPRKRDCLRERKPDNVQYTNLLQPLIGEANLNRYPKWSNPLLHNDVRFSPSSRVIIGVSEAVVKVPISDIETSNGHSATSLGRFSLDTANNYS